MRRHLRSIVFGALFACAAGVLSASPVSRYAIDDDADLVRVRDLGGDLAPLAAALQEKTAVVVDLRYVTSDLTGALRFGNLVARKAEGIEGETPQPFDKSGDRPSARAVLVLVNQGTAGPIEAVLDALQDAGDVLLVGSPTAGRTELPAPGITEPVVPGLSAKPDPDTERAAYDALESGAELETLLDTSVEKPRFDEATLIRQHSESNGGPPYHLPEMPDRESAENDSASKPASAPAYDRTLHRAINTIRAARALGKL